MSLDIQPVLIFADGTPVSSLNPLPTTGGGGGGGTVDQGAANGDAAKGWSARLTDGAAFIVPAKTGQFPTALGATIAADSVSVGIATDQLSTLATAAKQDTGNASLASIDTKLSAFSSGTSTVSSVNCASAANLFASNSSAKSRWIYNPIGNGTLYVRLGSGSHTGVSTSTFFVEGGQFVRVYPLDFTGQVQGLLAAGSQTIQATEVA